MIELRREGPIATVQMRQGENRFNVRFLSELNAVLDKVEGHSYTSPVDRENHGRDRTR